MISKKGKYKYVFTNNMHNYTEFLDDFERDAKVRHGKARKFYQSSQNGNQEKHDRVRFDAKYINGGMVDE